MGIHLKRRTYAFVRDELITLAPALTAALIAIVVAPFLPRDLMLFLSVLAILAITAALAAYTGCREDEGARPLDSAATGVTEEVCRRAGRNGNRTCPDGNMRR